jgi:soluble cytochrome b562
MSDAQKVYKAAERKIAKARKRGDTELSFNSTTFHALDRLPPEIGTLDSLERLLLEGTRIADTASLTDLENLQRLDLEGTQVADIAPLQGLENLQMLLLNGTRVADLRPLADLPRLGDGAIGGLYFADTPAARVTPELTRLSQIVDNQERTRETLAYLKTLPPWPDPLPWAETPATASPSPETATGTPERAAPDGPPPHGLPRRITAGRARQVLETHSADLRDQCQFVTAQINDTLAQQIPAKPNDPAQLEAWTHLVNTLELARAAVTSLQGAVPEQTNDRPVTDDEANRLKQAFETAIAKLQEASAHIDGAGEAHGRTCAGLLKIGVCSAVAAPIALISAQPMALVGSGLYAMLYGKGAALDVVKAIGAAASLESENSS